MSLSDEFFKQEEGRSPIAKWLVVLIVSLFLIWLFWAIKNDKFFKDKNDIQRPLTTEEKKEVLDELSKTSTVIIKDTEKTKILNNLSKNLPKESVGSEEKNKILQNLSN